MLLKIYGGTVAQNGDALCETCRHSRIVRGCRLEEELVFCGAVSMAPVQITFKVISCSDYVDDREPSYYELLDKAWILRPASKRRPAGFVRAADLKPREAARVFSDALEEE